MTQPPQTSSAQPQPHRKPKLRWFQFGLRTLGIVMTALCVGLAWLIHDVREQEAVVELIQQRYGHVQFGEPSWLGRSGVVRSLFGEHAFTPVSDADIQQATDADLVKLKALRKARWLQVMGEEVTDLSPLAGLSKLESLNLCFTGVSDLSPLAKMNGLTSLMLTDMPVRDLSPLARLSGLNSLILEDVPVTDLSPLAGLRGLTVVYIVRTQVSDLSPLAGLSELEILDLFGSPISDLSPLVGLKKLQYIRISADQQVLIPDSLEDVIRRD